MVRNVLGHVVRQAQIQQLGLALDDGNDVWAEQILKACKENMPVRRSHAKEVAAAGFDSASEALRMQQYYLEAVEKETK